MNILDKLNKKRKQSQEDKFKKFGLKFNPFPKSGTANLNESSDTTKFLEPIDDGISDQIVNFVGDSLYSNNDSEDYKLIGTITGDYGTGKTQLLMFAKWLIQSQPKKAFVVYINNPGTKLSELIGSIIESIGQEQFKKYLWNLVISKIKDNNNYKEKLKTLTYKSGNMGSLFESMENFPDPYSEQNEANHKLFLEAYLKQVEKKKHRAFNSELKSIIIEVLAYENEGDTVVATYFYDLISEDFGINKTWETITSGSGKYLDKKVVKLLNAIIEIVKSQGFERFYLLVDEFEDITSGRLTKKEIDNYSFNLRALIDKERRWCLLIAMTSEALEDLMKISPPLVDRLTDREMKIERLSKEQVSKLVVNYLNLARDSDNTGLYPFTKDSIEYLNSKSEELPRLVLRRLYFLLERACDNLNKSDEITREFIDQQLVGV